MTEISWRAASLADAADLAGLFTAIELAAPIGLETRPGEVTARLRLPQVDLGTDTLIGTESAHGLIAYAEATDMGTGAGQFRVRLTCAIHPRCRRRRVEHHAGLADRARRADARGTAP